MQNANIATGAYHTHVMRMRKANAAPLSFALFLKLVYKFTRG